MHGETDSEYSGEELDRRAAGDLPTQGVAARAVDRSGARRVACIVLFLILAGWVAAFLASGTLQRGPSPKYLGGDFALFLSAARVTHDGGNPYDQRTLYRAERALLERDGITPPAFDAYMRVGNPSLVFWALQPLTALPFVVSAAIWCAAMYLLLALGFLGCMQRMGWRLQPIPLIVFLAFPQTIYAAYYGNLDGLVFVALGWGAALATRRPIVAGALLTMAFLKPQVALPAALLILLFLTPCRRRAFAGFAGVSVVGLILTILATGTESVGWWLQALGGYSQRLGVQPDIASLSGLYVYSASNHVRLALEGISLLLVAGVTVVWWWRQSGAGRDGVLSVAWLWFAWFLATPFAHFHDEVVLTLPVLAVLGRDARWVGRWPATVALYVLLFSVLAFPASRAHTDYQSLTLLVVLGCAAVQYTRHRSEQGAEAAASNLALGSTS